VHSGGRWQNRQLTFDGHANKLIAGVRWLIYPTQNPLLLRSGRLLVPVTMESSDPMRRKAAVLISDDRGDTFVLGNGTGQVGGWQSQWETTVWEPTQSANSTLVWMFDRNNSGAPSLPPDARMLFAKSTDAGFSFTKLQAVRAETVVSRMLVTALAGDMFMLAQNDWKTAVNRRAGPVCPTCPSDRVNAAMWFNRGGGINFVEGPGFAVGEPESFYPQTFVDLQKSEASICYTGGGGIHLSVIKPLPNPKHRYVYPRTNMPSLFSGAPVVAEGVLTFRSTGGWMHSRRNASLGTTYSLAVWVKPNCNPAEICLLADTRDGPSAPLLGLLPSNVSAMQPYFFPAPGSFGSPGEPDNLASGFEIRMNSWSFVGASVDCDDAQRNCTAQFFINGRSSPVFSIPRPPHGGYGGAVLKLARFIGSFRAVGTFP
jgi:hypothetical protein